MIKQLMRLMLTRLSCFAAMLLVFGANALQAQGTTFSPFKITLFEDAAQIASKGIVNFKDQKADIPMSLSLVPETIDLVAGTSETKLVYFKLREDSIPSKLSVGNWGEVLQANMGKRITIVYDAGMEVDEVTGEAKVVNTESGMLLLKGGDESQYFIPFAEITKASVGFRSAASVSSERKKCFCNKQPSFKTTSQT